MDLSMDN
jgi:hypothetical protein